MFRNVQLVQGLWSGDGVVTASGIGHHTRRYLTCLTVLERCNFFKKIDLTSFARIHHTNPATVAKMIKHEHAYSISCRPEAAGGIVLSCDAKTVQCYVLVNFEVAICSIFRYNRNKYFLTLKLAAAPVATLFVADRK